MKQFYLLVTMAGLAACNGSNSKHPSGENDSTMSQHAKGTFGYDIEFLKRYHQDLVVLSDSLGSQVAVLPAYQGRVMTSTAEGDTGKSFGWLNYDLIASGKRADHMNAYGGEDRFWLGPEGGQFSLFFKKGTSFDFENWHVPAEMDTEPFELVNTTANEALFTKKMELENYSGTKFNLEVKRRIRLLSREDAASSLGLEIPDKVRVSAYESDNQITNTGNEAWDKQSGLLSIWILSMMNASGETTVAVPYRNGTVQQYGKIVTDDYFGQVPADRLLISPDPSLKNGMLLFKADGRYRSKIGISPRRALPFLAAYDALNNVLTIAQFTLPEGVNDYVNSLWKLQEDPFNGDAVNSYNDGPEDGKQMGDFFEVESSSPAAALTPGASLRHIHRTIHLKGSREELDKISRFLFGVGVEALSL